MSPCSWIALSGGSLADEEGIASLGDGLGSVHGKAEPFRKAGGKAADLRRLRPRTRDKLLMSAGSITSLSAPSLKSTSDSVSRPGAVVEFLGPGPNVT